MKMKARMISYGEPLFEEILALDKILPRDIINSLNL
jgi:hypothetical protein